MRGSAPPMNLPQQAMPWGRWLTDGMYSVERSFESILLDTNSVGAEMKSRLDSTSQNIGTLSRKRVLHGRGADMNGTASNPSSLSSDTQVLSFAIPPGVSNIADINVRYAQPSLVTQPSGTFLGNWLVVRTNGGQGINFGRPAEAPIVFGTSYPFYDIYASVSAQMSIIPGVVNTVSIELWSFITGVPWSPVTIRFQASDINVYITLEEET